VAGYCLLSIIYKKMVNKNVLYSEIQKQKIISLEQQIGMEGHDPKNPSFDWIFENRKLFLRNLLNILKQEKNFFESQITKIRKIIKGEKIGGGMLPILFSKKEKYEKYAEYREKDFEDVNEINDMLNELKNIFNEVKKFKKTKPKKEDLEQIKNILSTLETFFIEYTITVSYRNMLQKDNEKELMTAYKKIRKKRKYDIEMGILGLIAIGVIIIVLFIFGGGGGNINFSSGPVGYSSNQQRSSTQ